MFPSNRFSAPVKSKHEASPASGSAFASDSNFGVSPEPVPDRRERSSRDGDTSLSTQLGDSQDAGQLNILQSIALQRHIGSHSPITPRSSTSADNGPPRSPSGPSSHDSVLGNESSVVKHAMSEQVLPLGNRIPNLKTSEKVQHQATSDTTALRKVTPQSKKSESYGNVFHAEVKYTVDEVNKYLEQDLLGARILPTEQWAHDGLNLDLNKDDYQLPSHVRDKFASYLKVVGEAKNERDEHLYPALVDLLNSISDGEQNERMIFYKQDAVPVRGSHVMQIPDIGAVFQGLIKKEDTSHPPTSGRIVWGHLCTVVEGKLEGGKMVLAEFGRDASQKPVKTQSKRRERDQDEDTSDRASKTRRTKTSQTSSIESRVPSTEGNAPVGVPGAEDAGPHKVKPAPPRATPLGARTQVAGYARDVLSHGVLRSHVIMFLVDSKLVRSIFYDRSAIVESGVLNLNEPEDQLIFAKMIKHMRAMPAEGLGIVPNLDALFMKDPKSLKLGEAMPQYTAADGPPSNDLFEWLEGSLFTFPYKDGTRTVRLKRVLFRSNGIIGRGTIVVRVECNCDHCDGHCDWYGKKLILKLSFPPETRVSEQTFMDRCKALAQGDHAWVLNHLPHIYWTFDVFFDVNTPQAKFKERFKDDYEMRLMRGSIQEELEPLSSLETSKDCAQVFYDVVQCHHWAWKYPKILHRDISQGNIMVREKDGEKYGVLNDWDLSSWVNEQRDGPTSKFRTGTKPYMAHEQHSHDWQGPHRFRHDLESLFYVILLLVCLYPSPSAKYTAPMSPAQDFEYEEWHKQDDSFLVSKKYHLINAREWTPPVFPFFLGFTMWLIHLQHALRYGFFALGKHQDFLRLGKQSKSFDQDTLDNHFSYETVVSTMHRFSEEELKTRGSEWQEILLRLQPI